MRELNKLDEGLTNIGFDIYEAIMESIEDSIDANSDNINIEVFNEDIKVNIDNKSITANRLSYFIRDDGEGITTLEEVFNFGKRKEQRFMSKEDLRKKNGIYHYGTISHLNVGIYITLYSKVKDEPWKSINVIYNQIEGKAYIDDKAKVLNNQDVEKLELLCRNNIPSDSGSIIYVRGVTKDNITKSESDNDSIYSDSEVEYEENVEQEELSVDEISEILKTKIGIKYKVDLENTEKPVKIMVNNKQVYAKDIFLNSHNLPNELRTNEPFKSYNITLDEIARELNDNIRLELLFKKYSNLFENKNDILKEYISIDLYALSSKFKDNKIKKEYADKVDLMPSEAYSGFYIRRNNIYIGNPMKIMGICTNHPSYNLFRGEIRFSPIFDEFFEIQVNKNKCRISNALIKLIENAINNPLDDKLIGSSAQSRILHALKGEFKGSGDNGGNNLVVLSGKVRQKIKKCRKDIISIKDSLGNSCIKDEVAYELSSALRSLNNSNINGKTESQIQPILNSVNKVIKKYKRINKIVEYDFINDFDAFKARVEKINLSTKLRFLDGADKKYLCLEGIREPNNEVEIYRILHRLIEIDSSLFEFTILDYDYKDSLDNVIEINEEVYSELKIRERFDGRIEDIDEIKGILNEDLNIDDVVGDKKYCFMEIKKDFPLDMNHPMRFVSHIICWNRRDIDIMRTKYINYEVDNENDMIVFRNQPRVKIIYLKEFMEKKLKCRFE